MPDKAVHFNHRLPGEGLDPRPQERYPVSMAWSDFHDVKGPLARALGRVAEAGPGSVLAPVWADVVGGALATRSRPVRLHEGVLTVEADPEFLPDLERERDLLRDRLNARLGKGAVRQLRYLAGGRP